MLTRGVINTVKAIDALTKQMASIDRERDDLIYSLKSLIQKEDQACGIMGAGILLEFTILSFVPNADDH